MIIDLDEKTVTFARPQVLTLAQLWSLIELMDDDVDDDEDVLAKLADKTRPIHLPRRIYSIESDQRNHVYCVVQFEDGSWACSCPDWTNRKSLVDGSTCKHIARLYWR